MLFNMSPQLYFISNIERITIGWTHWSVMPNKLLLSKWKFCRSTQTDYYYHLRCFSYWWKSFQWIRIRVPGLFNRSHWFYVRSLASDEVSVFFLFYLNVSVFFLLHRLTVNKFVICNDWLNEFNRHKWIVQHTIFNRSTKNVIRICCKWHNKHLIWTKEKKNIWNAHHKVRA